MMNRNFKLALLALLGFSPACSSVKNPRKAAVGQTSSVAGTPGDSLRRIIQVMYGVRPPKGGPETRVQQGDSIGGDSIRFRPRIIVMYGVRPPGGFDPQEVLPEEVTLPADSLTDVRDSTFGIKCVIPPAPKEQE